jgi:predicted nucleotidyltransferase
MILPIGRLNHMKRAWQLWRRFAANSLPGNPSKRVQTMFNQDFKEFIESLNDNQVRYLVVGGYAVAFHGHPRYTKDLDIWIDRSPDNIKSLIMALAQFGFASLGLKEEDFMEPDQVVQLGYPPNRIDIITTVSGVDFPSCYPRRKEVEINGVMVKFINLDDLRKNKKAASRLQDLADLKNLE